MSTAAKVICGVVIAAAVVFGAVAMGGDDALNAIGVVIVLVLALGACFFVWVVDVALQWIRADRSGRGPRDRDT